MTERATGRGKHTDDDTETSSSGRDGASDRKAKKAKAAPKAKRSSTSKKAAAKPKARRASKSVSASKSASAGRSASASKKAAPKPPRAAASKKATSSRARPRAVKAEPRPEPTLAVVPAQPGAAPAAGFDPVAMLARLDAWAERIGARGHATFPGRIEEGVSGIFSRWVPKGDWRDFDAIRDWADAIAADLEVGALVAR